ncbi:hypothetical protein RRG08_014535, partial [Elysia crispata]
MSGARSSVIAAAKKGMSLDSALSDSESSRRETESRCGSESGCSERGGLVSAEDGGAVSDHGVGGAGCEGSSPCGYR